MKIVLYKTFFGWTFTDLENYNSRIQDARRNHYLYDCATVDEAREVIKAFYGASDENIIVIG